MPSRGQRYALADHRREFRVAVDLAQPDLPRRHETEEQADGGVLGRQRPLSLDPPTELFVEAFNGVRGPQRLPLRLGEAEKGEQLVAALGETPRDPRTARAPLARTGGVGGPGALATGGVDEAMEVLAELGERMLGRFALEIPQLVHATPLHRSLGPRAPDGPPQPRVAVDDAQQRRLEAAADQRVDEAGPGVGRLGPAQLQRQELLLAISEHPHRREHGHADHLARAADAQGEGVEIEIHEVDIAQRAGHPRRESLPERGHDAGDGSLRERGGFEQRRQRPADPPGVAAGQIGSDDRFVHLAQPALVTRHDRRGPFRPAAGGGEHDTAGERERQRSGRPRQGSRLLPVAVPAAGLGALVHGRAQRRGQFLLHRRLDRAPHPLVNQLAQRDGFLLMRSGLLPATLVHGAFLHWPPWSAVGWWLDFPTGRMRHFSFSTQLGTRPSGTRQTLDVRSKDIFTSAHWWVRWYARTMRQRQILVVDDEP